MVKNLPAMQGGPGFDPWVRKSPWRREWLPTPGDSQRQRGLAGYSSWGGKGLDTTEPVPLTNVRAMQAISLGS